LVFFLTLYWSEKSHLMNNKQLLPMNWAYFEFFIIFIDRRISISIFWFFDVLKALPTLRTRNFFIFYRECNLLSYIFFIEVLKMGNMNKKIFSILIFLLFKKFQEIFHIFFLRYLLKYWGFLWNHFFTILKSFSANIFLIFHLLDFITPPTEVIGQNCRINLSLIFYFLWPEKFWKKSVSCRQNLLWYGTLIYSTDITELQKILVIKVHL
jgi:hypothetical protein